MKKWFAVLAMVVACGPNCVPYKDTCACDIEPEVAKAIQPSDEKPPTDKMPSYQREGIVVINVPNMADEDRKLDHEKAEADTQGKLSAGLKP